MSAADDFDSVAVQDGPRQSVAKSATSDFDATPIELPKENKSKRSQSYEGNETDLYSGLGEAALKYGSGIVAAPISGLAGIGRGLYGLVSGEGWDKAANNAAEAVKSTGNALTYEPDTDTGKAISEAPGQAVEGVRKGLNAAGELEAKYTPFQGDKKLGDWVTSPGKQLGEIGYETLGPGAGAVLSALPAGVAAVAGARLGPAAAKPAIKPEELPADVSQYAPGGSAASTLQVQLAGASPEVAQGVQQAIRGLQQQYGNDWRSHVDFDELNRHLEADALPVPGKLASPQAKQEPTQLSDFYNNRAKDPRVPQFLQWQNKNLADNLSAIREQVGPDVTTTDMPAHGDTLINGYKNIDAPKVEAIKSAYKALEDANGGNFPIDAQTLAQNVQNALAKKLLSKQDPAGQMSELTDLARRGGMTMENYLSMRQNLGDVARTSADPSARVAASTMIDELEKLPLQPGAGAEVKQLADTARSLAKQRFDDLKADPAYKAAVEGNVAPDHFVRKFVINGNRDDIATMAQNLSSEPVARQTMGVAVLDHLRDAARLNPNYEGNFAAASFNKQLGKFSPSAQSIFQNGEGQTLQSLGNYATNATTQPKGSFINNSNTAVVSGRDAAIEKAKSAAASGAEALVNAKVPFLGSLGRAYFGGRAKAAEEAANRAAMEENFRRSMNPDLTK